MSTFLSLMIQKLKVKDYMHTAHKEWYPPTFSIIHYIFLCILTFKSASYYNICPLQLPVQSPVICFLRFWFDKKVWIREEESMQDEWMEDLSKYNAPVLVIWGLQNSDSNQRISLDTCLITILVFFFYAYKATKLETFITYWIVTFDVYPKVQYKVQLYMTLNFSRHILCIIFKTKWLQSCETFRGN